MGKTIAALAAVGTTAAGIAWFYLIMYSWLWLGSINAGTTGWAVGYALLFAVFCILTFPVVFLLGAGYLLAATVWDE